MRPLLPSLCVLVGCGDFGLADGVTADGGPLVAVTPEGQIVFEPVSPSGRPQFQEVNITAAGDVAVYIAAVWVESEDGAFSTFEDLPFPKLLDPGEAIPMDLRFKPPDAGVFHGVLVVESGTEGALLERQILGEGCVDSEADGQC